MQHKPSSRLTLHGVQSGLGIGRVLTSGVRRFYERKYKRSERRPLVRRAVFIFDLLLVAAVFSLLALAVSLAVKPVLPATIDGSIVTGRVIAASGTPVVIKIKPVDNRMHTNVRIRWYIPPGTEVLSSSPPMLADGTVYLGDLRPGEELVSRAVLRTFRATGDVVSFFYTIQNIENGGERSYTAIAERQVRGSALTARVPEEFHVDRVTSQGAVLPIEVTNHGDRIVPFVELRASDGSPITFPRKALGDLAPGESRYVYVPLSFTDEATLEWSVYALSREIDRGSWSAKPYDWLSPDVESGLLIHPNEPGELVIVDGQEGVAVAIVHPFLSQPVRRVGLHVGENRIFIPASPLTGSPQRQWLVAPILLNPDGDILGSASYGVFASPLPLETRVLYYSDSGDQLGIGPHPPRVSEETRYWVFWNVGPTDVTLTNVRVSTDLPAGVRATGNVAAPDGGVWHMEEGSVTWQLDQLDSAVGANAVFGFEISIIPGAGEGGNRTALIGETNSSAVDSETGIILRAQEPEQQSEVIQGVDNF